MFWTGLWSVEIYGWFVVVCGGLRYFNAPAKLVDVGVAMQTTISHYLTWGASEIKL